VRSQAENVANELLKRLADADTLFDEAKNLKEQYYPDTDDEEEKDPGVIRQALRKLGDCLNTIFGTTFKFVPSFSLRNKSELSLTVEKLNHGNNAVTWLQKAAHTHKRLKQFEDLMILSESWTGSRRMFLEVGQLPHPENKHWLANPLGDVDIEEMQQGSLSLILSSFIDNLIKTKLSSNGEIELAGLIVDEWDETIPSNKVNAAITYHYNRPNTEAPQCILLAVPPFFYETAVIHLPDVALRSTNTSYVNRPEATGTNNPSSNSSIPSYETIATYGWWYLDSLAKIVEETIDLSKIRAVDLDAMRIPDDIHDLLAAIDDTPIGGPFNLPGWIRSVNFDNTMGFGHFLPALYIPTSIEEDGDDE